jgi:hypothetical protein
MKWIGNFLEKQCYDHFGAQIVEFWVETEEIFANFFVRKIFKIVTLTPSVDKQQPKALKMHHGFA